MNFGKTIGIAMSPEEWQRLQQDAAKEGMTISALVRATLEGAVASAFEYANMSKAQPPADAQTRTFRVPFALYGRIKKAARERNTSVSGVCRAILFETD